MTALADGTLGEDSISWRWPISTDHYDHRELSDREQTALAELGIDLLRRHGHRDDARLWRPIQRLLKPLEDAHAALRSKPSDLRQHRRFAIDAMGLVLARAAISAERTGSGAPPSGSTS